jgi:high-affinity Fe2+/Pb2+ permease
MTSPLGKFSHTIVGYDSAPAVSQIVLYWGYLAVVIAAYLLPLSKPRFALPWQSRTQASREVPPL